MKNILFEHLSEEKAKKAIDAISANKKSNPNYHIAGQKPTRYIMFKTPVVPNIGRLNKAREAGNRKAMFEENLERELMYEVSIGDF